MIAPSTSSTNDVNTAKPAYKVSTASPNDLEQIHEDDLKAMDLKWQLSLLSMRAKRKHGNNEDTSSKAMLAIDGVGFDWSDMADEQVQTNMALMAFLDSECDDLIVTLYQTKFTAATYKSGLATIEEQLITYRKNEVLFSEKVVVLKREVACKDYEINVLKSEFEKVKQEKEGIEFKIEKFDKASKDLDKLLGSRIINKSKKGLGYNVVPLPHPLIYNRPKKLDLSYSGLDEFKDPEFKSYGSEESKQESNIVSDKKSDASKENSDDSLVKEQVSKDTSSFVESPLNVDKETVFLDKKIEIVKPKNHEKLVKKSVRVNYNYTTNRTHPNAQRNMVPRAVLMKTGLKPFNTARTVNTAHPKSTVFSAKPMSRFSKSAQSTVRRPYQSKIGARKWGLQRRMWVTLISQKTNKKNDVKARSLLLMALPYEHQLTFSQYTNAKTMFTFIETRFGGNEATKKTQKILLKQQYENFSASTTESLDFIINKLQKIVSRLVILGVFITQEDLNSNFLTSLPPEWNTHVVVWMNKAEIETMSIDDLYNNFKIVERSVKKSIGTSIGAQNMAFMTAPSTSSTNDVNTAKPAYEVSIVSPNVNTASPQVSTASFSDNVVYAFMIENPNGSNLLQQDLEQIHEDDLEVMDLKWQLSLLSMRAKRYFQRTSKKIFINTNDTIGYDKSKVECFNCHKMGHFAMECRVPRNKEGQFRNQDNTKKHGNNEDTSSKAMLAIDGVGFDWSDMAEEQVHTNMAQMTFSNYELNQTEFTAATYKRGLATVEEQLITYRKNEVLFSEEVAVLKREVACKDYEINVLKSEFEKVKQEKEGIEFKIEKFDKALKDLDKLLRNASKENSDDSLVKEQVSEDTSSFVESPLNVDKETVFLDKKIEIVKPKNHEKPVKKSVRYAEMYRSQSPRGNQRNWNGQKSNQLGSDFVMYNKACFICGSFDHVQAHCKYHQRERMVYGNNYNRVNYNYTTNRTYPNAQRNMVPRAVLMKTGLKPFNTARTVNTAHPKSTVYSAKPMSCFSKSAQSTVKRPYQSKTVLTNKNFTQKVNTAKAQAVNTARPKAVNTARPKAVKTARPNSAVVNAVRDKPQQDDTGFVDSGCSRHMTENIAYLSDFKEFDRDRKSTTGGCQFLGNRLISWRVKSITYGLSSLQLKLNMWLLLVAVEKNQELHYTKPKVNLIPPLSLKSTICNQWAEKKVPVLKIILTGIDNDIYSTFDACPNACKMWKAIERSQQSTRNRGKAIVTSYYPTYDPGPATVMKKSTTYLNNNLRNFIKHQSSYQDNSLDLTEEWGYNNQRGSNVAGAGKCRKLIGRMDTDDEVERTGMEAHFYVQAQLKRLSSSSRVQDDQDETDDLDQERDLLGFFISELIYLKKFQAELDKYNDVNYASKVEIDCAKAKGDLMENKVKFSKPEFLKKAQRANPRLYDIGCYNDNLALMLALDSDETIRLEKERRSKLSDLIRPFDYDQLNNLYDLFVPQREKSAEQHYFPKTSKMSHTSSNKEFPKSLL
ncbi:putative ribonuclease H-like domain-containing protein [Tanacetum coccineum]